MISKGQKKYLKKQGIDADAYVQEWNKAHSENSRYNLKKANEKLDDMGALANAFLGEDTQELPQNRQSVRKDGVRNEDERNFLEKVFTKKEKQNVKDSEKYAKDGGTKVNIHSSQTAERKAEFAHDISDDVAKAGNEFLDAYADGYKGKRREKFSEIDENGNVTKTKVIYRKDGSVKKVVRKSDDEGKIVVKEARDGHITVKGDLQSDNIMKDAYQTDYLNTNVTEKVETTIVEKCPEKEVVQTPPPPKPIPEPVPTSDPELVVDPDPIPPALPPEPKGLIMDFVNDDNTGGFGSVQGVTVREQYDSYGAQKLVAGYCSYIDGNVPEQAKKLWGANCAQRVNSYNAEKIAQSLIHDIDDDTNPQINEKALANVIEALRATGNDAALSGIKRAILRHNKVVKNIPEANRGYDSGTRSVNKFVTANELAIEWLIKEDDL